MILCVKDLEIKYGKRVVVSNFNVSVSKGEVLGIWGANGSGKSSVCLALAGLLEEAELKGEIQIYGKNIKDMSLAERVNEVGIIFQDPETQLFSPTVEDEIAFAPENLCMQREEIEVRIQHALKVCGICHLRHRKINSLSGGEKQLTAIASVIAMRPKVLIADEIGAHIDSEYKKLIYNALIDYAKDGAVVFAMPEKNGYGFLHTYRIFEYAMKIKLANVAFGYNKTNTVLKNISYEFNSGNIYVLCGANGSGKTTLSMLLTGLLKSQNGEIYLEEKPIKKMRIADIASKIGYLFQNVEMQLFANTVYEELSFPYVLKETLEKNNLLIENTLSEFRLDKLKDSFPMLLSGGEKQRLALATIFIRDVNFLILDEPSASIDEESKKYLASLINNFAKKGGGVILITHDEGFAQKLENTINLKLMEGNLYET